MLLLSTIKAHLENHFPSLIIFYGEMPLGKAAQCHFFVPEAEHRTRTYILLFGQAKDPAFKLFGSTYLKFGKVVVDQAADILGKIYPNTPQKNERLRLTRFAARLRSTAPTRTAVPHAPQGAGN